MAQITVSGANVGNTLSELLTCKEITPGDAPSYQTCKTIYLYHPLGGKMAESPIAMAQSQRRKIGIPNSPEQKVRDAFEEEWRKIGADGHIFNIGRLARVYGISSIVLGAADVPTERAIDPWKLADLTLFFNDLDPLNTAGSLTLNQDPNSPDFQKHTEVRVNGKTYHRSRAIVLMNESPVYIAYTQSAFGFVGRSVYQRALFPLKSFVNTMIADDMVARKCGVLVAMIKQAGSIIDGVMARIVGLKRQILKEAETDNVISIGSEDKIESLNLQHVPESLAQARKDILENTAVAADMPAKLLNSETFAEGFGEGTEDAKNVARYIERIRIWLEPIYAWFDNIVMYRAWNERFYQTIQAQFGDEYGDVDYKTAFATWKNSFKAEWPSLLIEPESEQIKVEDVKFKTIIAALEVLMPQLDPINKAMLIQWAADNMNENKLLFTNPLLLDMDALENYTPPPDELAEEPAEPKPFKAEAG